MKHIFFFIIFDINYIFSTQVPPIFRQDLMEVQINPKGMSSEDTTWRGAAILSCLGSAQELWISPKEWNRQGQKLLREKAPFPWA